MERDVLSYVCIDEAEILATCIFLGRLLARSPDRLKRWDPRLILIKHHDCRKLFCSKKLFGFKMVWNGMALDARTKTLRESLDGCRFRTYTENFW